MSSPTMKFRRTSYILFVFHTLVCVGQTQNLAQRASCGLQKFRCHNGDCIDSELLCDGRADCRDKSDETSTECLSLQPLCPAYAFKCAYGACIDGDKTCNGIQDCEDNSDETLPRCGSSSNGTISGQACTTYQFKCASGQCIANSGLCDGHVDCADGSDESSSACSSFSCPHLVFRCSYGACIDGDKKCDGERNCADGSDEDPQMCSDFATKPLAVTPSYTPTRISTSSTTPRTTVPPSRLSCVVPPQPENGHWKLHRSQCGGNYDCDLRQGMQLQPGAYLIYSCNPGYKIKGIVHVFCGSTAQWSTIPTCEEVRCKPLSTASTNADCKLNGEWTSCEVGVAPQTVATLTCRNSYRAEASVFSLRRDEVRCNENGEWEPEPIRCVPECGTVTPHLVPVIVNGTRPALSDFPWHATLYKTLTIGGRKEFICGATIIQENLLITAAHCVYNEGSQTVEDPRKFFIATGNIFRDYDSQFHDPLTVNKAEVKNIYVVCNYLGFLGNFAWDIAIIEIVKPFKLSSVLHPVCLDIHTSNDQAALEAGNLGKVAGFGRTAEGPSSAVLQALTVPYVPINQCKSSSILHETEKFITIDKFCAGYTNGSSVCDGDSGGGLVFKTDGLWYLRGVVSVSLGEIKIGPNRVCDSHTYSLYTRVSSHISWIQDVILRLERFKTYPACPSKRT